jgi:hypothetical protein
MRMLQQKLAEVVAYIDHRKNVLTDLISKHQLQMKPTVDTQTFDKVFPSCTRKFKAMLSFTTLEFTVSS